MITADNQKALNREFIRLLVDEKLTYAQIAKRLGYKKSYIKVKVHRLKKKGYLISRRGGYQLSEKGYQFLVPSSRLITDKEQMVNIHFHKIKAKVLKINTSKKNVSFLDWVETLIQLKSFNEKVEVKENRLKNTKLYIFNNLFDTEIRCTSKHVLIKIPKHHHKNLDSCLKDTEKYFKKIVPKIERYFDIELDNRYINQYWISTRHIEHINHKLALIHQKYDNMDIEVIDEKTGEKLLYFDKSGGTINAETESVRKGIDISYNLEQIDMDIVNGLSMSENKKMITSLIKNINQTQKQQETLTLALTATQKQLEILVKTAKNSSKIMNSILQAAKPKQVKKDKKPSPLPDYIG